MDDSVSSAAEGSPFSCVMLLAVHGAVFVDVPSSLSTLESKSNLRAMALSDISRGGSGEVVSLVSPSNLGYSNMNSENAQFPNHPQVFIEMIESMSSSGDSMNDEVLCRMFNSYENRLYSFFRERTASTLRKYEDRLVARRPQPHVEKLDVKDKLLTLHRDEMPGHDFDARMQVTRDALGLRWRPHQYAIGNKKYCPGGHANKCCLYFPGVDDLLREKLESKLFEFRKGRRPRKLSSLSSLFDDLYLKFDSHEACVLTILFENDTLGGYCKNPLWIGVSLAGFFQKVCELLRLIFHDVDGFSVKDLMLRTCVVDSTCSDFSVRGKGVSIVGFNKDTEKATGNVSALLDVYDLSEEHLGFWEYWIRHNQADAARRAGAGTEVPRRFNHRVDVPRELEDFVPACLTCLGSTIQNIEPVFDSDGNVVRVVYTYYDKRTEVVDYVPRERPDMPTESMEAVQGSPDGAAARAADVYDYGDGAQSVSPTRRRRIDEEEVDGGRRRWCRTLKKKCMKKCKTKRQQRRLRRCKMTRRMVAKGRGRRRTCVRRL